MKDTKSYSKYEILFIVLLFVSIIPFTGYNSVSSLFKLVLSVDAYNNENLIEGRVMQKFKIKERRNKRNVKYSWVVVNYYTQTKDFSTSILIPTDKDENFVVSDAINIQNSRIMNSYAILASSDQAIFYYLFRLIPNAFIFGLFLYGAFYFAPLLKKELTGYIKKPGTMH